jgi:cysteine-rich repeat protein
MAMQNMNIRVLVLGAFVLAGGGCFESMVHDERCGIEQGDATCQALRGGGYCSSNAAGCPGEGEWYGCVFARPTDECYSPTGNGGTCAGSNPPSECIEVAEDDGDTGSGMEEPMNPPGCGDGVVNGDEQCDDGNKVNTDGCIACDLAVCGDGVLHKGVEACDDGNMVDGDNCTNACTVATCGDAVLNEGVEQCDDGNMDNTDACVGMCMNATCGDMFVQDEVEECDDGNLDNTDMCTDLCRDAECGDGFLQGDEECDDGGESDSCSSECEWARRIVFVTSTMYDGNLGGLGGADKICNERAEEAGLPGTYMAWISTNKGSPATRFVKSKVSYVKPGGDQVADDWEDLVDGPLLSSISKDEFGGDSPTTGLDMCGTKRLARTGTAADGTAADGLGRCNNFTSNGAKSTGTPGDTTEKTNDEWTSCGAAPWPSCDIEMPIYCFQQ